jgi:acetaldehyde dehydrogenase/alcohol dehydrogenase
MKKAGCYFATQEEIKLLEPIVINTTTGAVNPAIVGQPQSGFTGISTMLEME